MSVDGRRGVGVLAWSLDALDELEVMHNADWWGGDELRFRRKYSRLPALPRGALRQTD